MYTRPSINVMTPAQLATCAPDEAIQLARYLVRKAGGTGSLSAIQVTGGDLVGLVRVDLTVGGSVYRTLLTVEGIWSSWTPASTPRKVR